MLFAGGLLSVFVDAYMDGSIEDALLVPVSINYERIVDGNFVREQLGQPKQMETFSSAVSSIWSALTSHYGIMRVDFNQPFSLRVSARQTSVLQTEAICTHYFLNLGSLGRKHKGWLGIE